MKRILTIFALPALAMAASFSGTILDLKDLPVPGVVVKTQTESTTTTSEGKWLLARAMGVATRPIRTTSVASHLVVVNGHPSLVFGKVDGAGRGVAILGDQKGFGIPLAARGTGSIDPDTLYVFWKGKRLAVVPLGGEWGDVVVKVDTAWKDDAGIPWNPGIPYGSVQDDRDGQTYRTVTIGTQTWMAENFNYAVDSSRWLKRIDTFSSNPIHIDDSLSKGGKFGRLYRWAALMGLPDSCNGGHCLVPDTCLYPKVCPASAYPRQRGVCPVGWHVPSDTEWTILVNTVESDARVGFRNAGGALRAASGWTGAADSLGDLFGFRGLPASPQLNEGVWWSASKLYGRFPMQSYMNSLDSWLAPFYISQNPIPYSFSARCLKD